MFGVIAIDTDAGDTAIKERLAQPAEFVTDVNHEWAVVTEENDKCSTRAGEISGCIYGTTCVRQGECRHRSAEGDHR